MGHTPGPWGIRPGYGLLLDEVGIPDRAVAAVWTRKQIARREDTGARTEACPEGEANARLIAAAPELLEALKRWLGAANDPRAGWHGSGGTTEVYACEYCNAKHGDCTQVPHAATCPIPFARAAIAKAEMPPKN